MKKVIHHQQYCNYLESTHSFNSHRQTNKQTYRQLRDDEFNIIFACVTFCIQIFQTWLQNIKTIPILCGLMVSIKLPEMCQPFHSSSANWGAILKFLKSFALKTVLLKLNSKWHQMKVSIACKVSDHQLHDERTGSSYSNQSMRSSATLWMHRHFLSQVWKVQAQVLPNPSMKIPSIRSSAASSICRYFLTQVWNFHN